jgi:thiol-disulfide isomerase/thioredoxin
LAKVALTPVGTAKPLKLGVRSTLPTVVNVWATWCVPCRKELPDFNAAAAKYAKTVRFVGVNAGQTVAEAEGFIAEIGVTFDQYVDEEFALQSTLSLTGMPTTVFLDTSGAVVKINQGSMNAASLDATIGEVFGATPSP